MSQLQIDPVTKDLVRSGGSFQRVEGAREIAQHVTIRFGLYRGEVPWNVLLGIPYPEFVLSKDATEERVEGVFADAALGTPGMVSVDSIDVEIDRQTRRATLTWRGTGAIGDLRRRIPLHDTVTVQLGIAAIEAA